MTDEGTFAGTSPPGVGLRWRPVIPAILLVVVALNQIRLVYEHDLDPWKGGGFGMFSTANGGGARHTHLFLSSPDGEVEVDPSEDLEDIEGRLRSLPTEAWLDQLARALVDERATEHPDLEGVRIELWRTRLDPVDLSPRIDRMRNHRYIIESDDSR